MILIIPSDISVMFDDNHYLDLTCQMVFNVRNLLVHCDYYSQHFFFLANFHDVCPSQKALDDWEESCKGGHCHRQGEPS
jgi:hypothetical protein